MVNKGPDSNGSQFFVTLGEELEYLDGKHTLFGRIAEGRDEFVAALNEAFVDDKGKPYKVLRIRHATILHDPFDDPKGMPSPPASPPPPEDDDVRIGDWEEIPEDTEIREEELKKKDAKSRAEVLEMIGDLPDADVKPPDHVLFICKLNKVTRSSDLDLIFSRFGECQADIIKDQKTGDSLCYGFIEFETKKACEDAYFKMNNCLIDDRRIKVDFSQSVSKLWNDFRRGKGGRPQFVDKPAAYQNPSKAGGSGMVFDTPMLRREALAEDDAYLRKKRGGRVPRDADRSRADIDRYSRGYSRELRDRSPYDRSRDSRRSYRENDRERYDRHHDRDRKHERTQRESRSPRSRREEHQRENRSDYRSEHKRARRDRSID